MRLQIHRQHFGVDPDNQWWQKTQDGWVAIPKPGWAKKKHTEKVVDISTLRMEPPTKDSKIEMVTLYKVSVKTVPDYEAEVLKRHGWTTEMPVFACKIDEGKQLALDIRHSS